MTVGLITNVHPAFGNLLQWILLAFDLEYRNKRKVEHYQTLVDFMISEYAQGRRTVLIVDEAQNMDADTLEELRVLSNINADKHQVLQLILVGQCELRNTLRRPELRQFAQRITVDYHLEPLEADETGKYVCHRIKVAGGDPDIIEDRALEVVHLYSGGVPRLINNICDMVLVYGYAEQQPRIDADLVEKVIQDKLKGGLFPAEDLPGVPRKHEVRPRSPHRAASVDSDCARMPAPRRQIGVGTSRFRRRPPSLWNHVAGYQDARTGCPDLPGS